ncbi:MAG: pilus assembly protein [Pseudomonadota bacterium]
MTNLKTFIHDEAGAVTIDWVAMTAGMLLLGIALVFGIFNNGVDPLTGSMVDTMENAALSSDLGEAPDLNPGS